MRVNVWGCRGSLATPGPATLRYGGNTSCVEVCLEDGPWLILDAGTGIRPLGLAVAASEPKPIHILLTHLHLDHLEGLGFFTPLWRPETELHIWGPPSATASLAQRITRYLSPPLFPVTLQEARSTIVFHDIPDEPWQIGGATICASGVIHPGATVGYRVTEGAATLAYLPDHEPYLGGRLADDTSWVSGFAVAEGATVLMHDAQYSEEEYLAHVGWGHSSVDQAVEFAKLAGADHLLLFHHDPLHTDADLDVLGARAREVWGDRPHPPALAAEGMQLDLHQIGETSEPSEKASSLSA